MKKISISNRERAVDEVLCFTFIKFISDKEVYICFKDEGLTPVSSRIVPISMVQVHEAAINENKSDYKAFLYEMVTITVESVINGFPVNRVNISKRELYSEIRDQLYKNLDIYGNKLRA
jgi:hypothetical protein